MPRVSKSSHKNARWVFAIGLLAVVAVLAGCGTTTSGASSAGSDRVQGSSGELKVAFLYSGPANDAGWSESFDRSRMALKSEFGNKIVTTYKENVPETSRAEQIIDGLVQDGADLVIGTSYGEGKYMVAAARKYPNVYFLASQWKSPNLPNFSGFDAGVEDGTYVAGVAAGYWIEDGGDLGWVDAFAIPYDLRMLNGFALGVKRSNPTAKIQVALTNSWTNTSKMGQAATSLTSNAAELLGSALSSPPVAHVSERTGTPFVAATGTDASSFAPKWALTTIEYDWAEIFEPVVKSIINDEWESKFIYAGMGQGVVKLASWGPPFEKLTAKEKMRVRKVRKQMSDGQQSVFTGPIKNKKGNTAVAAGETLSVDELEGMNFVVANVNGVTVGSDG